MNRFLIIFVFLTSVLIADVPSYGLTIPASEDTFGYANQIASSSNSSPQLLVDPLRTAFLYFDLNDIPSNFQVRFAKLRLFLPSVRTRGAGLQLHLVTSEWNEALKSSQPTISAGTLGIIEPEKLATRRFVTVDVTSTVQGWISRTSANEGFAVKPIIKAGTLAASVILTSKEGPSLGLPAELDIEFEPEAKSITSDQLPASLNQAVASLNQTTLAMKALLTPTITSQPILSFNGSISAAAQGIGNLTYQWYKDGVAVVGGTSANLPMDGLISGTYALKTSNGVASSTSSSVAFDSNNFISNFSLISAGTFQMGDNLGDNLDSNPVAPVHNVYVSKFFIAQTDLTYGEWQRVKTWGDAHGYQFDNAGAGSGPNYPVTDISWYDAVKFCNAKSEMEGLVPSYYTNPSKIWSTIYRVGNINLTNEMVDWAANGYRLPTEAEWEKATRALVGKRYPNGDTLTTSDANFDFSVGGTTPVKNYASNGYGLQDMAGNVWQWCWDWLGDYDGVSDPQGPLTGNFRTARGGAWNSLARDCRVSRRYYLVPQWINGAVGFRLARSSKVVDPPTLGLVAYYPFNGDAKDASGNGNDGILRGSPALSADHLGRANRAYAFDGVRDYIDIGKPLGQSPQDFSEAAWVKIIAAGNNINGHSTIFSQRENIGSWGRVLSMETDVMKASFAVDGHNHLNGVQSTTQFQFGVWMHVCGVRRGGTHEIYVNGVLEGSLQDDYLYDSTDSLHLMHHSAWNTFTNGCLEGVRIYNHALTAKDVAALYNSEK